jgi:hypothetical protein
VVATKEVVLDVSLPARFDPAATFGCMGVLVMVIVAAAGCASAPVEPRQPMERSGEGVVSFEQIRDQSARRPEADVGQEYRRPVLEEGFALPAYPPEALAANAPPAEVAVRLVVATDGSVASVTPSPLAVPPEGEWEELFYRVVRDTVAGWRYEPCELRELEDGADLDGDGSPDYRMVVASTPVQVYLDLVFRFEIFAGTGQVSTGGDNE